MPATTPHFVMSMTNCIGAGRHAIPISNVSHCVFIALHNALLSASTTNADHEPARRYLLRVFTFIAQAFTDPYNIHVADDQQESRKSKGKGKNKDQAMAEATAKTSHQRPQHPMTAQMRDHLPDLCSADGILDVMALRSYIVLFIAFGGAAYDYRVDDGIHKNALPLKFDLAKDLEYAWTLALALDEHIVLNYEFEWQSNPPAPTSGADKYEWDIE